MNAPMMIAKVRPTVAERLKAKCRELGINEVTLVAMLMAQFEALHEAARDAAPDSRRSA